MYQVKGKWALITGAARGIGYLTAKFMAAQGCNLILHSRSLAHTEKILSEARACGISALSVEADLGDPEAVQRMLEEIDGLGVDVDIVLNNAGLQIAYRTDYFETPVSDYEISFRVNTIAPAMICYHFLPKMIARGTGRILNTTSGITDVMINLTDPGWCRTDLGGNQAPNAPESAIPGIVVGVFADDKKSGRYLGAQNFAGMTLEAAVEKAEREFDSPYGK